jgi:hypothetical protein
MPTTDPNYMSNYTNNDGTYNVNVIPPSISISKYDSPVRNDQRSNFNYSPPKPYFSGVTMGMGTHTTDTTNSFTGLPPYPNSALSNYPSQASTVEKY